MAEQNWFQDLITNVGSLLTPSGRNRIARDVVEDPGYGIAKGIFSTSALGRASGGPLASPVLGTSRSRTPSEIQANFSTQIDERGRVEGRKRRDDLRQPEQEAPTPGPSGPGVSSVFAPLFDALDQQRRNAESRYSANAGQIQNIYGQIIGARSADIDDIQEAYGRLQEAAAARGESTLGKMAQREQQRQTQNEAVLQSMGVGDIGSATDDVAAQAAAVAQDVEMMNQSNWSGMLDAMGKTSEEIARADITSYGYRQGEDIARLQAAKEDYLQNVADQEFQLKFEEQQAKLAAAQAAAAAQAEAQAQAARDQARAEEQQYEEFIKYADPLTQIIASSAAADALSDNEIGRMSDAYGQYMSQIFTARPPSGMTQWNAASAAASFGTSPAAEGLSTLQRRLIEQAIRQSF